MPGRSITLFLIDGTPQGMRRAEVGNWTGIAVVCPRTDLARLATREEVHRTGIYLLIGPSETSASKLAVYVGEGDDVWSRLSSHDDKKDFWTWVVVFVSKDENLTKAHVRWLEARLVADLRQAKRAEVTNANVPGGNKLPESDAADMETYYEHMRLLLPTLGVSTFATDGPTQSRAIPRDALLLELRYQNAQAECVVANGQFIVQPGSTARVEEVSSLGEGSRAIRKALRDEGVLEGVEGQAGLLRFTQEYAFDSPSGAAAVVAGAGLNGRVTWKVKNQNISYKEWQERQVSEARTGESDGDE